MDWYQAWRSATASCQHAWAAVTAATGGGGAVAMAVRGVTASAISTLSTAGPAQRTRSVEVTRFMGHLLAHEARVEHRDGEFRSGAELRRGDGDGGTIEHVPGTERPVGEPGGDGPLRRGDDHGVLGAGAAAHERELG